MKRAVVLETTIIILLLLVVYIPIYGPLYYRFTMRDSYYSHGFLIPFVTAYLIFRRRNLLRQLPYQSSLWGLYLLISGVLLHLVSTMLKIRVLSYFSVLLVLFGIVLYLKGRRFAKELLFPLGFLIFMFPLPKVLILGIAFKLKLLAAQLATWVIGTFGVQVAQVGSRIYYPGGFVMVGDPCSGLRSIITFLALGALFTYFSKAFFWKRGLLFLTTIPIALFSNLMRLVFLVFISYVYGEKVALGFLHDFSGIMVFGIGFLALWGVTKVLQCTPVIEKM